ELIRNVGVGARHGAKQRRLARIGIADQRDARHGNLLAHAPPRLALLLDAAEAAREYAYPLAEEPPVGLELRLAGSPEADAAFLPLEVSPAAHEAGREMFQLRELDFELAFEASRALREDVENQLITIEHAPPGVLLEVALLARRERMIDEDHVRLARLRNAAHFLRLATAEKESRVGTLAPARHGRNRPRTGGQRELCELLEILGIDVRAEP